MGFGRLRVWAVLINFGLWRADTANNYYVHSRRCNRLRPCDSQARLDSYFVIRTLHTRSLCTFTLRFVIGPGINVWVHEAHILRFWAANEK